MCLCDPFQWDLSRCFCCPLRNFIRVNRWKQTNRTAGLASRRTTPGLCCQSLCAFWKALCFEAVEGFIPYKLVQWFNKTHCLMSESMRNMHGEYSPRPQIFLKSTKAQTSLVDVDIISNPTTHSLNCTSCITWMTLSFCAYPETAVK